MTDLQHAFGDDLAYSPTGDLALATGSLAGQQRVLRRLLTNPGDYVWDTSYGAGLAQFVGGPAASERIRAVVRAQIFREAAVARTPEPTVDTLAAGPAALSLHIRYADTETAAVQVLSFPVGGA